MISENPYQSLFWDMIAAAQKTHVSDIHIQPSSSGVSIRFRVFGDLSEWTSIADIHRVAFLQEAKRLCQCSLAISGRPQDSRIALPNLSLDIRVSLIPSLYGEKIVLRLLDQTRSFSLENMGLSTESYEAIHEALKNKTGVNLLTGPTGSGKTTLLYSALAKIDRNRLNIVTIEDPIEYTFPGITQIQVSSRLSMNDALRTILRQDPDVILLGEIRDAESASLCFQAASTGHLVLSTLHANNAREAATRLATLGVDSDLVRNCLRFTSAQRLLPKLCQVCRIGVPRADNGIDHYTRKLDGCNQCHCGAVGRVSILEFIEWKAIPRISPSLKEVALRVAAKGEVDLYDALSL